MRKENVPIVIALFFLNAWIFLPHDLSHAADSKSNYIKTLEDFVNIGRLSDVIKKQIEANPGLKVDVIVEISTDEALDKAKQLQKNQGKGQKIERAEIIAEMARIYNSKKSAIFSEIPPQQYAVLQDYSNLPVIYVEVNELALRQLLDNPDVTSIEENRKLRPFLSQSLSVIDASSAHNAGLTGAGTHVAVLDTGVDYTRDAFENCAGPGQDGPGKPPNSCKVAFAQDFTPTDDGSRDDDPHFHGTNVSGIVVGVAPDTKILGLDVFRTDGFAYTTDIASALQWVSNHLTNYNIRAVNMSLGGGYYTSSCPSASLSGTISTLKSVGVSTVISSGNDNYNDGISWPACIPSAISVGAVYDQIFQGSVIWDCQNPPQCTQFLCQDTCGTPCQTGSNQVACASNSASFLTMLAPGAMITAAGETLGGTSQAAPHVSGAIAAIGDAIPSLSPDRIASLLTSAGVSVTDRKNSIVKPRLAFCINSARIGGSSYTSLQAAYDNAANGATIQVSTPIIGNLNANRNISVTLQGGYDCDFASSPSTGVTYIKGSIHTSSGSLSIGKIVMVQ